MLIKMNLGERSYPIYIEKDALQNIGDYLKLDRKVLIVTDSGVPCEYAKAVASKADNAYIEVIDQGEQSKNFDNYRLLLKRMLLENFTRSDCVVAVGGGVVGDLAGFAASSYMRGIDFYNIPTTVLSQVDSSIGGKVAIDFEGYKNIVGAFYQPKAVVIDSNVLKTLPERQISNGLAEALKMSLTSDKELFEVFENGNIYENLEEIIIKSLNIKKNVVEQDEKEAGLRRILNFGHTIGHGIESEQNGKLYHGECVAAGMLPMCSNSVKQRLLPVLRKLNLPCKIEFDKAAVSAAVLHDKKFKGSTVSIIKVYEIGSCRIEEADAEDISRLIDTLEG